MTYRVLVVDDDPHITRMLQAMLEEKYRVSCALSAGEAVQRLRQDHFDLALLDVNLPDMSGLDLLQMLKQEQPGIQVIMITGGVEVRTAVEAMKRGAYDYIQKPFDQEDLLLSVARALEERDLKREVDYLRSQVSAPYTFENIIATSPRMQAVFEAARKAASVDSNVLIVGETGTGKELLARAIHYNSRRRQKPFVAFNCARFTESLIESELFGHEAGAFTGATRPRKGIFEQADGGTLFLDEVGLTPPETQSRLLRVLEERKIQRLGAERPVDVDVRLIAATNADLTGLIEQKKFRSDLYYRLKVIRIEIPPLRERREDIPLLASYFLKKFCDRMGKPLKRLDDKALELFLRYDWPGNVRELENLIEMLVVLVDTQTISGVHVGKELFSRLIPATAAGGLPSLPEEHRSIEDLLNEFEKRLLINALERNGWNKVRTAQELGWHRNTLDYKIKKLGITR